MAGSRRTAGTFDGQTLQAGASLLLPARPWNNLFTGISSSARCGHSGLEQAFPLFPRLPRWLPLRACCMAVFLRTAGRDALPALWPGRAGRNVTKAEAAAASFLFSSHALPALLRNAFSCTASGERETALYRLSRRKRRVPKRFSTSASSWRYLPVRHRLFVACTVFLVDLKAAAVHRASCAICAGWATGASKAGYHGYFCCLVAGSKVGDGSLSSLKRALTAHRTHAHTYALASAHTHVLPAFAFLRCVARGCALARICRSPWRNRCARRWA